MTIISLLLLLVILNKSSYASFVCPVLVYTHVDLSDQFPFVCVLMIFFSTEIIYFHLQSTFYPPISFFRPFDQLSRLSPYLRRPGFSLMLLLLSSFCVPLHWYNYYSIYTVYVQLIIIQVPPPYY